MSIRCLLIEKDWAELDSMKDYQRLLTMLEDQCLFSLLERRVVRP